MLNRILVSVIVSAALASTAASTATAVTNEQFELRSGADLVALCSVETDDPVYSAALHFCHGFGVGMYGTIMEVQKSMPDVEPIICAPEEALSRNQYFERFVAWAKAHADRQSEPALDLFTRFLKAEFSCTK